MFGNANNSFGNTSFGGFGQNNNQQSGGLFGNKSTFGNNNSSFGSLGFGNNNTNNTNNNNSGIFGSSSGTGLFGNNNNNNAFGLNNAFGSNTNNTNNTFGSNNNAFGGNSLFGGNKTNNTTTSLFGNSSTNNTFGSTNTFGSNNNSGGLFGNNSSGGLFGGQQLQHQNGTNIKYNPLQSTDTQVIKGTSQTVQIKLHAISCMKEYESKSLEELRCEDYLAGRKSGSNSTMQNNNNNSGGLFGGNKTTNSFGSFGNTTSTSNSLFGNNTSNTNSGGIFGNNNNNNNKPGGLFGNTTSNNSSGLFGNTNNTFGSTNTFGNNTNSNTNNAFGNTNSGGLFGNNNNNNKSTGLFGNNNNTNNTGGLFGNTNNAFGNNNNTNTNNTGGGLFGNTNNNSGGLFGNSKPSFGNTGTTSTFGNTGGNSLFGSNNNAQNKSPFMMGNTNTGGSLFGNTSSGNTGGGLFNNTNTGGGLFGNNNNQNKPGGLFGNTNFGSTNTNNTSSLFGANNNTNNNNSLFGGNNNPQPVLGASLDTSHIHQVVAALSSNPYGDSPLFRTALAEKKKLNPATPPSANIGPSKSRINPRLEKVKPKPRSNGYNPLFEGLEDDISPSPEAFLPRNSLKKLVLQSNRSYADVVEPIPITKIDQDLPVSPETNAVENPLEPEVMGASQESKDLRPISDTPIKHITPIKKLPFNSLEDVEEQSRVQTVEEEAAPEITQVPTIKASPNSSADRVIVCKVEKPATPEHDNQVAQDAEPEEPVLGLDGKPLKAQPPQLPFTLERPDYYTIPGPNELLDMIKDQSLLVKDLVVGRTGYGEVKFLGEVDLWGLDIDSTVLFRRKEITVYPDDSVKPPQGEGLNRRAEVTLESVYPVDKGSRNNITNPQEIIRRGFPLKLEKMTAKMGAKFMEYRPENGQWTFMVKHFSKYGLSDESSDEEQSKPTIKKLKEEQLSDKDHKEDNNLSMNTNENCYFSDEDNNSYLLNENTNQEVSFAPRPVPKEYQGYRTGLFGLNESEDEDEENEFGDGEMFIQSNQFNFSSSVSHTKKSFSKTALKMEKLEMSNASGMESPRLLKASLLKDNTKIEMKEDTGRSMRVSVVPSVLCLPPLSKSVAAGFSHLKMDHGLTQHFAFRVGWCGKSDSIITKSQSATQKTSAMKLFDTTKTVSTSGLTLETVSCGTEPQHHVGLLHVLHRYTTFEKTDADTVACTVKGSFCLEDLIALLNENQDVTNLGPALEMIKALWADEPHKEGEYARHQFRKERLSSWLGDQLKVLAQEKTLEYTKLGVCHLPAVLAWLCAGGTEEACQILCKEGDFQLALMLSQSSTPIIRQLLLKQLHEWRENGYDAFISDSRIKIYILLAGKKVWESSTRTINVFDGLDWMSSFALFLRFLPPSSPLDQAVDEYQDAFNNDLVQMPYADDITNLSIFWQLLVLYCNPAYSLCEVLNAHGISGNTLDERDVWFIWVTLNALGVPQPSQSLVSKLATSYAAQLNRLGLWDWAIFIAQHLPSDQGRKASICKLIECNIPQNNTTNISVSDKETTCLTQHKVDTNLFNFARVVHGKYKRNWMDVVLWCTIARDFNTAHRIFMDRLGPYRILSRKEEGLLSLLEPLYQHRHDIQNWEKEGGIYYSYLSLPLKLPQKKEELDFLRGKISILGNALNELPFDTIEEQCAVNMMGLRSFTLLIEVWKRVFSDSEYKELVNVMKSFPLPVDYGLNDVLNKFSDEIDVMG